MGKALVQASASQGTIPSSSTALSTSSSGSLSLPAENPTRKWLLLLCTFLLSTVAPREEAPTLIQLVALNNL